MAMMMAMLVVSLRVTVRVVPVMLTWAVMPTDKPGGVVKQPWQNALLWLQADLFPY